MFYRTGDCPLPIDPFKALVSPRPIGWISTRDRDGRDNLAPYSFFNAVADAPPMVMFASSGAKPDRDRKDSLDGIRDTGVFCVNIVSRALGDAMNASSAALPAGESEFAHAGIASAPCREIACLRVDAAPAALECRLWRIIDLPGEANAMAIGEVVAVWIDDAVLDGDRVDVTRYAPLSRLGYRDYAAAETVFRMTRPQRTG